MLTLEEENNRYWIEAYDLQDELSPEVPEDQITLYRPNREEDIKRLISYAIGCMMGRYSLDKPGLVYAHSGNKDFDPSQYQIFPADDDGIIPMMEIDWFSDDASNRLVEFIRLAWPKERLAENLTFIADSLGPNRDEQPRETIRRYLATGFYKHHLAMYKRRPIYWLFSSGKHRAFQCLVYLHRYHEGTLSRMRTEYVIPLQGKMASRMDQLADDIAAASSTSHRKKLEKERDTLRKQHAELQVFDEQLRHYADRRISLDLDDGVKVNYGKFGDLLAEVEAITGGSLNES
jgi:type II restriction/modification system DNA methylase subunit YeeA